MKHYRQHLVPPLVFVVTFTLTIICGCGIFNQGSRAQYNTLASIGFTVDSAVTAYYDGVARGIIATNNVPKVSAAYNEFQSAYEQALHGAEYGTNSPAPQNLINQEQTVLNAVGGIK